MNLIDRTAGPRLFVDGSIRLSHLKENDRADYREGKQNEAEKVKGAYAHPGGKQYLKKRHYQKENPISIRFFLKHFQRGQREY